MRAIIPENGVFVTEERHEDEGLVFNADTSELVWNIASIPAFSKKRVSFQIIVSPQIATQEVCFNT